MRSKGLSPDEITEVNERIRCHPNIAFAITGTVLKAYLRLGLHALKIQGREYPPALAGGMTRHYRTLIDGLRRDRPLDKPELKAAEHHLLLLDNERKQHRLLTTRALHQHLGAT